MIVSRRGFLRAGGALALAGCAPGLGRREGRGPIVDAHVHCFAGPNDPRFPYHERAPYRPDAAAPPERLLALMDAAGVDYAVVVHPEPYQDDHRYLEHVLDVGRGRLKGTCLFFADRLGAIEGLRALVRRRPEVAAVRIHAYAPERLPPFGRPELREFWRAAADRGLAVQLHFEPRYAEGFEPYLREFPDVAVIVDHLGRPLQGTPAEHERVVRWSERARTWVKLSSLTPPTQDPHRDLEPFARRLAAAYGAGRLMYGGGFDARATAESYRAERERARALVAHLSAAEQAAVLGGTAARLFGFPG